MCSSINITLAVTVDDTYSAFKSFHLCHIACDDTYRFMEVMA